MTRARLSRLIRRGSVAHHLCGHHTIKVLFVFADTGSGLAGASCFHHWDSISLNPPTLSSPTRPDYRPVSTHNSPLNPRKPSGTFTPFVEIGHSSGRKNVGCRADRKGKSADNEYHQRRRRPRLNCVHLRHIYVPNHSNEL